MLKNKTLLITGGTGSFGNAVLHRFINTDEFSGNSKSIFAGRSPLYGTKGVAKTITPPAPKGAGRCTG